MAGPLAVLIVEDVESDAQLIVRMLKKAGYTVTFEQVETASQMRRALKKQAWEIVISDFSMPELDGFAALKVLQETDLDIPFVVVSGTMGEETAVAMMKAGAHDYVMKGSLARLVPAVERELKQAEARREARRVEHQKQERVKELRTLFGLTMIIEREGITLDEIYQELTNILPTGWQYPEIAYARMVVRGSEFCTKNFKESAWMQSAPIKVGGTDIGKIEVGYLEKRLDEVEGPFLQEERELIDAIAQRIGKLIEEKQAEEALWIKNWAIESSINAIAISDLLGILTYVNPAFIKLWGYGSPAQIVGESAMRFWQMGKKAAEIIKALQSQGGWVGEMMARSKDGACFEVEVAASMVKDVTGLPICMIASFSDISERKQAEETLRDSEARYRTLFQGTADGILIADIESRMFRFANPAICRLLGYSEAELQTMGVSDIHPKADLPAVLAEFEAQASGDKTLAAGLPCLRKDGTIIYADVSASAMSIDGKVSNVGFFRDITERKLAEEALRKNEATLQATLAAIPDLLFEVGLDGRYLAYHSNRNDLLAAPSEEFLGKLVSEVMPPDATAVVMGVLLEANASGQSTGKQIALALPQGQRWFELSATRKSTGLNEEQSFIVISRDITERKLAEEALRESEEKYRNLVDRANDGIVIAQGNVIEFSNSAFTKNLGYEVRELNGIEFASLIPQENRQLLIERHKKRLAGEEVPSVYEAKLLHKNGNKISFEVNASVIQYMGKPADLVILRDLTERKKAEQKLLAYSEHLEEMVEERTRELSDAQEKLIRQEKLAVLGQISGSVSHELRNPLGVISNAIYFLNLVQPDADDKVRKYHAMIEREVHTADKIIADLLDFARLKSAHREPVSIPALVQSTLRGFPVPPSVKVALKLPADLPMVFADPRQVEQVLGNLITNAYQAMEAGGKLTISGHVVVPVTARDRQKQMLAIAVKDTGGGILPENRKKLFEPLFTTKVKGIGLGLAVSKKLAESNDGRIEVESQPGKGSTFTVWLPVQEDKQ
jgi:PAS domain S-box-containing protein